MAQRWRFVKLLKAHETARESATDKEDFRSRWTASVAESGWTKREFGDALDASCWLKAAVTSGIAAKDPLWPREVVRSLEAMKTGAGLDWASRACLAALERTRDPKGLADEVRAALEVPPDTNLVAESEKVWHLPGRDEIQTAVANLLGAAALGAGSGTRYVLTVSSSLWNVAETEGGEADILAALDDAIGEAVRGSSY